VQWGGLWLGIKKILEWWLQKEEMNAKEEKKKPLGGRDLREYTESVLGLGNKGMRGTD